MTKKKTNEKKFSSLKELQLILPRILKTHADNQPLAMAALANPILALEKSGYSFTPQLRREIELRVRFGEQKAKELTSIQAAIFKSAKKSFDLDSPAELSLVLKTLVMSRLRGKKSDKEAEINRLIKAIEQPYLPQMRWSKQIPDPLEKFKKIHEIIPLLLEYRRLEASEPRLASEQVFQQVYNGKRKIPVTNVRFRLQSREKRKNAKNQ